MMGAGLLALCWAFNLSPWLWFLAGLLLMEKICKGVEGK